MTSLKRALIAIGGVGFAAGMVAIALVLTANDSRDVTGFDLALGPIVGWAFIYAGLIAWWRRPDNRFGSLMTLVGFTWFLGAFGLSDAPGVFVFGLIFGAVPFAVLLHMLLAFPSGRLEGTAARRLVRFGYFAVLVMPAVWALFIQTEGNAECDGCPRNPLSITENDTVAGILFTVYAVVSIVVLIGVAVILVRRWRRAPAPERRLLGPLYLTGGATVVLTVLVITAEQAFGDTAAQVVNALSVVVLASVPFAFLYGLLRTRLAQSSAVTDIVAGSSADLRDTLAAALGDPSLELAYWLPERKTYVDREGRPIELPDEGPRAVTRIDHDGRCVAAIVHDPALNEQPGLVDAAGAAAALALENERLEAELRARVEELEASRARIVHVGLAERRRIERDLHDGAQQRLVALRLQLRLARDQAGKDPEMAQQMLDGAMTELDEALAELRELARGIHPAVLADRGLEPALSALAGRAPLPVDVKTAPTERLPAPVEAAAYFVVAEALTNVARYSQASRASVAVERRNGHAVVEVRDDGVGGADPSRGTGLMGLADRLAALDGRLEVDSPSGGGTVVRADIPCG